jgi:hypothetical protein
MQANLWILQKIGFSMNLQYSQRNYYNNMAEGPYAQWGDLLSRVPLLTLGVSVRFTPPLFIPYQCIITL